MSDDVTTGHIRQKEQSGPPAAITNYMAIWSESDNKLHFQDGDGNEQIIDPTQIPVVANLRGSDKTTTSSAASGGGTAAGTMALNFSYGQVIALRIKANGDTVLSNIEFFTDAAKLDRIYLATGQDCYTAPYYVDGSPWPAFSFANDLENDLLYYTITNNGANNSTYDIELLAFGWR